MSLALPFPLSQVLVHLPDAFTLLAPETGLLEVGAELAQEILDAFPDEDELVRMTLGITRASLLLHAVRDEGHALFAREIEAHPSRWEPVDEYARALHVLAWPAVGMASAPLWKRIVELIEAALRSSRPDRSDADDAELRERLDEARGRLAALPS